MTDILQEIIWGAGVAILCLFGVAVFMACFPRRKRSRRYPY